MIDKQWVNICTIVVSVTLLLFGMTHVILALVLNLYSGQWRDPITNGNLVAEQRTRLITGINILIDCLFAFPASWAGICASLSRHRGVYILLLIIVSLATLGCIGGIVALCYEFSEQKLFRDTGSSNDELAISMLVMRCIEFVVSLLLLIFGIVAVLTNHPEHQKGRRYENEMLVDYNSAMRPPSYASYQPPMITSAPTPRYAASVGTPATVGPYRQYTRGSPEWDKFYAEYFGTDARTYGGDYRSSSKRKANSFRY